MPISDSPLRYPGGKSQLTPFVIDLMKANDLVLGHYVEPFAGGAGIAWRLLFDNYASEVWINDYDPAIYAFWSCVLRHTDDFCELIDRTDVTMDEWHRQRAILLSARAKVLELGFATFFLNRTNRSGILKAGVIGGLAQTGNYSIDCRFKKPDLIRRVQRIAAYKERIRLFKQDAEAFLTTQVGKLPARSLLNIDPPYYGKGPELYSSYYRHDDHMRLARVVRQLRKPWMLTYDDEAEIRQAYNGLPWINKELNYYAQVKRLGVEFMAFSKSLIIPASR